VADSVADARSYFDDVKKFAAGLAKLGFDVTTPSIEGAFVRFYAIKNAKKPDAKLVLPFRGAVRGSNRYQPRFSNRSCIACSFSARRARPNQGGLPHKAHTEHYSGVGSRSSMPKKWCKSPAAAYA
jgi:hypothetical protein